MINAARLEMHASQLCGGRSLPRSCHAVLVLAANLLADAVRDGLDRACASVRLAFPCGQGTTPSPGR